MDSLSRNMNALRLNNENFGDMSFNDLKERWVERLTNDGKMATDDIEKEAKRLAEQELLNAMEIKRQRTIRHLDAARSPAVKEQLQKLEEVRKRQELRRKRVNEIMQQRDMMNLFGNMALDQDTPMPDADSNKKRRIGGSRKKKESNNALFSFL